METCDTPPLVSIVVATRNVKSSLSRCLESLAEQTSQDFEVIVQDGASTDGTLALASSFASRLPALRIDSRPDNGVYDAWNTALDRIHGQWVLFLGADDVLAFPDVLTQAAPVLRQTPDRVRFVSGGLAVCDAAGSVHDELPGRDLGVAVALSRGMPIGHPALFHRATLFQTYRFDPSLHIASDYDFLCRTWTSDQDGMQLNFVVTRMALGGISTHARSRLRVTLETALVAARYFPGTWTLGRISTIAKDAARQIVYTVGGEVGIARVSSLAGRLRRLLGRN